MATFTEEMAESVRINTSITGVSGSSGTFTEENLYVVPEGKYAFINPIILSASKTGPSMGANSIVMIDGLGASTTVELVTRSSSEVVGETISRIVPDSEFLDARRVAYGGETIKFRVTKITGTAGEAGGSLIADIYIYNRA